MENNAVARWLLVNVVLIGSLVTLIFYQAWVIAGQHDILRLMMTNPYCMQPFHLP